MTSTSSVVLSVLTVLFLPDINEAQRNRNFRYQASLNAGGGGSGQAASFFMFSRESSGQRTELFHGNLDLLGSAGFDASKETKFIIHGWTSNSQDDYTYTVANAYLSHTDANVIAVDYRRIASSQYQAACREVHSVGRHVAQFVDWLVTEAGGSVDKTHILGYSLGAHIAGAAGEHVSVGKLGRITGLDSAGPGFGAGKSGRLDASDAQFVDVIHTSGLGYQGVHGHADFYPNGGVSQPECSSNVGQSHARSYLMYAESISSQGFVSRQCNNWQSFVNGYCDSKPTAVMGEHVNFSTRGNFYLHTAGRSPYALG